eukprot:9007015-Lingulodinium_polyedra.AAC.1
MESHEFRDSQVQAMRARAAIAPKPDAEFLAMLKVMPPQGDQAAPRDHAPWLAPCVLSRDSIRDSALVFSLGEGRQEFYKVLICFQKPYYLLALRMQRTEDLGAIG